MPLLDWSKVVARASGRTPAVVRLGEITQQLLTDLLTLGADRWKWSPSDSEWDQIAAAIAAANVEVFTNVLIGTVVWSFTGTVPDGCLLCDGTQYDRVDYPLLYAVLDAAFIVDADTFATPDLIGSFIQGSVSVGATGGSAQHTLTEAEMPIHSHSQLTPTINIDVESVGVPDPTGVGLPLVSIYNTGTAGSGNPHNNLPPYTEALPCLIAV